MDEPLNRKPGHGSQDSEDEDEDLDYYYYSFNEDAEVDLGCSGQLNNNEDPEYTPYDCLSSAEAEKYLQDIVDNATLTLQIPQHEAKWLLQQNSWSLKSIKLPLPNSVSSISAELGSTSSSASSTQGHHFCEVCANYKPKDRFSNLNCGHTFCESCWEQYFEHQINQGASTHLSCMSSNCNALAPDQFIVKHVQKKSVLSRFMMASFKVMIRSHPLLRLCPGRNCKVIIRCAKPVATRCLCSSCKTVFCFQCGGDYHAPTDCYTIKRWLTKCADDSETANYISGHTKDCPKCKICIEKNGGCNHMQCYNCKHDFCWMCLGDWKAHGSEYYECSRYKENPSIADETANAQAREALKKYLHYFERWENHSKSMKLEAQTLEKIKNRITQKVMEGAGTWIDWQYLLDASALLAKCRYTLQYTYPYAYYMESSPRKELFEYQQAQLEAEIENLSWEVEHAESTDRGALENQIDIVEKRRTSLLKDFLKL